MQGTIYGWQLRAYTMYSDQHQCSHLYAKGRRLELDHIRSRTRGDISRVVNLTTTYRQCNRHKDDQELSQFPVHDPERAERILKRIWSIRLRDTTHMNIIIPRIIVHTEQTSIKVQLTQVAVTSWNQSRHNPAKSHGTDAAVARLGLQYLRPAAGNDNGLFKFVPSPQGEG